MASDHSSSDFIRKRRKNFRAVLGEAPDTVLDELDSLLLITREEYDKIEGMPNPSDKARELINTMLRKGERACQQFLTALHKLQETLPRLVEVLAEGCPSTSDDSSSEHPEGKRGLEEFSQNQEQEQQQVLNITPSSPLAVEADSSYKETEAETGTEEFSPNQGPEQPKEECLEPELPALLSKEEKGRNLQEMLQNLGLQDLYTRKLSLSEVLEIGPQTLVCTKPQSLLCVAEYFLKKLMILSLTARNVKCTGRVGRGVGNAEQTDFSDIFDLQEQADDTWCNPLDVITAVFLCADSFLQQEMMFKMSMCQFALPLLLPDCSREGSTLLLWAMRSIVKKWRPQSLEASKGFKEETMATMNLPVISFIRLGNNSTSKSKVLNEVLSNPHQNYNYFVNHSMECGDIPRRISDGLVEFCWYLPCGKTNIDIFGEPIAVANLRGNAYTLRSQACFLAKVSSAVFVFVDNIGSIESEFLLSIAGLRAQYFLILNPQPCQQKGTIDFIQQIALQMKLEKQHLIIKSKLINDSEFVEQIRSSIRTVMTGTTQRASVEAMAVVARELQMEVDEDAEQCQYGKVQAEERIATIRHVGSVAEYKISKLPLQGPLWKEWSKTDKELCRMRNRGDKSVETYISELKELKLQLRKQQLDCDIIDSLSEFVSAIVTGSSERRFFLKWMKYFLDDIGRQELSSLRESYKQQYSTSSGVSEKLTELDSQIAASSLGLEHFMREIGQMYEAEITLHREQQLQECNRQFVALPRVAAELMLDGFPLELLDGDASSISVDWVTDVLTELSKKLGEDTKVFVLTVLGVQSTGKSTLLNTMFGLQFAVSSGRCTRGAFIQLIKITGDLQKQTGSDYIMIVDTEGLKAPELAKLEGSYEHDNELATLVVGLSDVTFINMAMENSSEMKDTLQIVVHAFLRMKEIGRKPNCQFIHQNVGEVSAHEQNMRDRKHLLDQLDKMTRAAAHMENKDSDYTKFSDVMDYDPEKHNWYIPGLWHGIPPMAPVNTGYSENVFELKKYLFEFLKERKGKQASFTIPQLAEWMQSLWKAVKNESFIFSFRNSLVADAYNQLCVNYSKWEWAFRKTMHSWVEKAENNIHNHPSDQLDDLHGDLDHEANDILHKGKQQLLENLEQYFESKTENIQFVEKFKADFALSAESLRRELEIYSKGKCHNAICRRKGLEKLDSIRQDYQVQIQEQVSQLLQNCRKSEKALNEEMLRGEFVKMWNHTVQPLESTTFPKQDIVKVFDNQLRDSLKGHSSAVSRLNHSGSVSKQRNCAFEVIMEHVDKKWYDRLSLDYFRNEGKHAVQEFSNGLMKECDKYVQDLVNTSADFDPNYSQMLLKMISEKLQTKDYGALRANAIFEVDIRLYICRGALRYFEKMHEDFFIENDPLTRLEALKEDYYSTFRDVYHKKDHSQKRAWDMCNNCLQPAMKLAVEKKLGVEIVEDITASCSHHELSCRSYLQATILMELLERHCVEDYIHYIQEYKEFAEEWIRAKIKKRYTEETEVAVIVTKIIQALTKKIKSAVEQAEHTKTVAEFVSVMCHILQDDIVINKESLRIILFENTASTQHFAADITAALSEIEEALAQEFSRVSNIEQMLSCLPLKPDEEIFKQVLGCGKQCPFCGVPCERGGSDHKEHFATIHRPQGLNRSRWENNERLVESVCTSLVASDVAFKNLATEMMYHPYKDYRSVNAYYASWDIPPDTSIPATSYWKYVLCTFNEELAQKYDAKPADVPSDWNKIQKKDIKMELQKTYNLNKNME
eukprot:gi/632986064/ref/XP_007910029.1/ PREDICTED: interferon-induced very large GTPase 1-like isoform X2 [Callorhinchus milii]